MTFDEEGSCFIIEEGDTFDGWDILNVDKFKKGVYKIDMMRKIGSKAEYRIALGEEKDIPNEIKKMYTPPYYPAPRLGSPSDY